MMRKEQESAAVTVPSKTMAGFSLYENAMHNLSMQYPSIWNKQEIQINNGHACLEVMFVVPIRHGFRRQKIQKQYLKK